MYRALAWFRSMLPEKKLRAAMQRACNCNALVFPATPSLTETTYELGEMIALLPVLFFQLHLHSVFFVSFSLPAGLPKADDRVMVQETAQRNRLESRVVTASFRVNC